MSDKNKALYLITGFLGSGKTTLLTELSESFKNERIAIIVNEFGSVGVDGDYLKSKGIESYEITNGSIFCVCRKDLFMEALKMANSLDVGTIIVETSGLSDPMNSDEIMESMKKYYNIEFDFRGVISLIDAKNFTKVLKTAVCVENQVKAADLFIINKCDLVSDLSLVKKELLTINSEAKIIETSFAKVDISAFKDLKHTKKDGTVGKKDIILQRKLFEFEDVLDLDKFTSWLATFKDKAYRIKGFIHTTKGDFNLECVMGDVDLRETKHEYSKSFIVLLYNSTQLKFSEIESYSCSK